MSSEQPPARPGRLVLILRWVALALLLLAGGAMVLATVASFAGPLAWWLDLIRHFRPHLAMGLTAVAILQLLVRPRWLAGAWAMAALVNAVVLVSLYRPGPTPPAGAERLAVVHLNTGGDPVDAEALAAWISRERPELISLQEITPDNLPRIVEALWRAGLEYRTLASAPRPDTRGVALLSLSGAAEAEIVHPTPDHDRPMVHVLMALDGQPLGILGFHATRPAPAANYHWQRRGLDGAALWSRMHQMAGAQRLVIGDFNSTSHGVLVQEFMNRAGLRDGRKGHGIAGTWPAELPWPLRIPIDGAYVSPGLAVMRYEVGPDVGSDHLPILVEVARLLPSAASSDVARLLPSEAR